jgi:hypothetical protein
VPCLIPQSADLSILALIYRDFQPGFIGFNLQDLDVRRSRCPPLNINAATPSIKPTSINQTANFYVVYLLYSLACTLKFGQELPVIGHEQDATGCKIEAPDGKNTHIKVGD